MQSRFEMSYISAILQLYSQETDPFGDMIEKRITPFDLLARCHLILNPPRMKKQKVKRHRYSNIKKHATQRHNRTNALGGQ